MLFLKDKLIHFAERVIERYRSAGRIIFTGNELTFRLLGHIANSQKEVEQHTQQLGREAKLLSLSEEQSQQTHQYYLLGGQLITNEFEASLRYFKGSHLDKELLLQSLWRMIWADRHLGVREYQLVHLFGYWLGCERSLIEKLGEPYRPIYITQEHQRALALLGVKLETPKEIIKQKYKRQLSIYHPDKIIGEGGGDEEICKATEFTVKIHEAYALIRMLHNF